VPVASSAVWSMNALSVHELSIVSVVPFGRTSDAAKHPPSVDRNVYAETCWPLVPENVVSAFCPGLPITSFVFLTSMSAVGPFWSANVYAWRLAEPAELLCGAKTNDHVPAASSVIESKKAVAPQPSTLAPSCVWLGRCNDSVYAVQFGKFDPDTCADTC
jgi:hypothetical protein